MIRPGQRRRIPGLPARLLGLAVMPLALGGCVQQRHQGDAHGTPVAVQVHLERGFVRHMRNRQWSASASADATYAPPTAGAPAVGIGVVFTTTSVRIFGGAGPGQAQVFSHQLCWGENHFSVPLEPGRQLVLTVQAEGGHEGAESLGRISIPSRGRPQLSISLTAAGARVQVQPLMTASPGAPAAAGPTQEDASRSESENAPGNGLIPHRTVGVGQDQQSAAPSSGPVSAPMPPQAPLLPPTSATNAH